MASWNHLQHGLHGGHPYHQPVEHYPTNQYYDDQSNPANVNASAAPQLRQRRPFPFVPPGEYELVQEVPWQRSLEHLGPLIRLARPPGTTAAPALSARPRQTLAEISNPAQWAPTRVLFNVDWPHLRNGEQPASAELDSFWFQAWYGTLYEKAFAFACRHFGAGDILAGEGMAAAAAAEPHANNHKGEKAAEWGGTKPVKAARTTTTLPHYRDTVWVDANVSQEFLYTTGLIARQDNLRGGWDAFLADSRLRAYLVVGIIGKVLQTSVFDDLLFGADEHTRAMLAAQDEALIEHDGYQRTNIRAQTVREVLPGDVPTPLFWPSVDRLAYQLSTLLLPLVNLLDDCFPPSSSSSSAAASSSSFSLRDMHQELHEMVAQAGFLSITIRRSRDIFRFTTPLPGEGRKFDFEPVDEALFDASRAAFDAEAAGFERKMEEAQRTEKKKKMPNQTEEDFDYPDTNGMVKVQLVLWPQLQRFTPVDPSQNAAATAAAGGGMNEYGPADSGVVIHRLMPARVVYYQGWLDDCSDRERAERAPLLEDHVRRLRRARSWRRRARSTGHALVVILMLLLGAVALCAYDAWRAGGSVASARAELAAMPRTLVVAFLMGWLKVVGWLWAT